MKISKIVSKRSQVVDQLPKKGACELRCTVMSPAAGLQEAVTVGLKF